MTQELYQKAMKFAGEKHHTQLVPGTNANYLLHISNVVMEIIMAHKHDPCFDLDYAIGVGVLHDTIEDTDATFIEIADTFGKEIAAGVQALTKDDSLTTKQEKMNDSLRRINQQRKEVGIVKLADRITNLQKPPSTWSLEKAEKYLEEAKILSVNLKDKNPYLEARLKNQIEKYGGLIGL